MAVDYGLLPADEPPGPGLVLKRTRRRLLGDTLTNTVTPADADTVDEDIDAGAVMPASGAPTAAYAPQIAQYRSRAASLFDEGRNLMEREPDISGLQALARQRGEESGNAMLASLAAQYAGPQFEQVGATYLKRALAAREPLKLAGGTLMPDGTLMKDPFASREKRVEFLLNQARAYEQLAQSAETAQERAAATAAQRDTENQLRKFGLQIQKQRADDAAKRDGGGQAGSFSPAGYTPQGQQVVTNTKSGISYLLNLQPDGTPNYVPYQGPMIPTATFNKEVGSAGDLFATASRADMLISQVEKNPEAFGLRSAVVSSLPGAAQGYVARMVGLTPEQLQARSAVMRQAAQEINELYGAALSMGEQARANTFLPNPGDPLEVLISKLRAARDWSKAHLGRFSPGVVDAAKSRSGASSAPGAPAEDPLGLRNRGGR